MTVAGGGAYLVGTDHLAVSFIEMLRNRTVTFRLGARRMAGPVGNVTIPKQTAAATAYWLNDEGTAITEGNQTFAQLALTPRTVAGYTEVSRLLQLQSSPDIDALIIRERIKEKAAPPRACQIPAARRPIVFESKYPNLLLRFVYQLAARCPASPVAAGNHLWFPPTIFGLWPMRGPTEKEKGCIAATL